MGIKLYNCFEKKGEKRPTYNAYRLQPARGKGSQQKDEPVFPAGFFSAAVVWSPIPLGGSGGMPPQPNFFCTLYIGMHESGAL